MSKPKKYAFVSCPYCGQSSELERFKKATFPISPLKYYICTQREQKGGKDGGERGFFKIPGSEKTILDLVNGTKEEKAIARKIVNRIRRIYESYEKAGLLNE